MAWVWWLAAPLLATVVVALGSWWRNRAMTAPDTDAAMREHREFLEALVVRARDSERAQPH